MNTRRTRTAAAFTVTAADLVEGMLLGTRSGGTAEIANLVRYADGSVDFDLIDHDRRAVTALTLRATGSLTSYAATGRRPILVPLVVLIGALALVITGGVIGYALGSLPGAMLGFHASRSPVA